MRHDLARGLTRSARARLADLPEPDAALTAEVDEANRRREEEERKAEALRAEIDPRTGRGLRVRVMLLLGTLWTLQPLLEYLGWLGPTHDSYVGEIAIAATFLAVALGSAAIVRRSLRRSRLNRQLVGIVVFILFAQILAYGAAAATGMPPHRTQITLLFLWFVVCGILGTAFERRLFLASAGFFAAFFVAALHPAIRLPAESAANLVLTVVAVVTWWKPKDEDAGNPPAGAAVPRP